MKHKKWIFLLSFVGLSLDQVFAQDTFGSEDSHVEVSLVSEWPTVVPGRPFWMAAKFIMDEGWHIYWENPGDAGAKPEIEWALPDGFSAGEIRWPSPSRHVLQGLMNYVYEGEVYLMVQISPPVSLAEKNVILKAEVNWTVCSDKQCLFGGKELSLELPVGKETDEPAIASPDFEKTRASWPVEEAGIKGRALHDGKIMILEFSRNPQAAESVVVAEKPVAKLSAEILWLAFLGGAILNLMPCVFPVIGLKIMGFVNQAGANRKSIAIHGVAYAVGVLVSFWILAGVLIALRQGGEELGWGFQLQDPRFVFVLALLLLVFALNLSGLFEVGASLMGMGGKLSGKSGFMGSFFSGGLATVMSTPCAAPFLATALGAALVLPAGASLIVFSVMALGLAFPYLVLSFFPKWVEALPKPGAWMETFKQIMAFPLYATVMFLLWTLAGQVDDWHFLIILFVSVLVAFAGWIYGRWPRSGKACGIAGVVFVGSFLWGFPAAPFGIKLFGPEYESAYFFSEIALLDPAKEQKILITGDKTVLKLPLAEYFEEELKDAGGRLKGILSLKTKGSISSTELNLAMDVPMEKVASADLTEFLDRSVERLSGSGANKVGLPWEKWTPESAQSHLQAGSPIYVDFTARWCATCQVNKRLALSSDQITQRFAETGLIPLKADWTKKGPIIARALAGQGRVAVPFNIIYLPDGGKPIILPEVLTEGIVLDALEKVDDRMARRGE
jgi:thiol:disulfide interchange protein